MQKDFTYEGQAVYYGTYGKGLPVVLLHGFGEDSTIWDRQVSFLEAHCRLVVPDLPGSGKSELAKSTKPMVTLDDFADCINALLAHEQISKCVMLGHSMGGYITLAFAEKFGGKVGGFGFVNSTAYADSDEKRAGRKKAMETIRDKGSYAFLSESIPTLFSSGFRKEHGGDVDKLIEKGRAFSAAALVAYTQAMMERPERTEVLKSSEVPVLFILGTDDVAAPLADVLQQVHLPRVSYIHILENVGHMSMLEATENVNKHLLDFIRDIRFE